LGDGKILRAGILSQKLRKLARELPGVHDLLPRYPALVTPAGTRAASFDDFVKLGANAELTESAWAARQRLEEALSVNGSSSCPIVPLVGVSQPTLQSFKLTEAGVEFFEDINRQDWKGDGTVYFGAAYPTGHQHLSPLPLQHGALANSNEGIQWVRHVLLARSLGPPQGEGIGLAVPDAALVDESFTVSVTAPALAGVSCSYDEAGVRTGISVPLRRHGRKLVATMAMRQPGLYTITVSGGGYSPVRDDVLVVPRDE
jgi:hypothetical protein